MHEATAIPPTTVVSPPMYADCDTPRPPEHTTAPVVVVVASVVVGAVMPISNLTERWNTMPEQQCVVVPADTVGSSSSDTI